MLGNIATIEDSLGLSSSSLADGSGRACVSSGDLKTSAKAMLKPVLALLDSNQLKDLSKKEYLALRGIRQQILSCGTERSGEILSQDLYGLAMGLVHHPRFGLVAQEILTVLKKSDLPHAVQAADQLDLLRGEGGSFSEYCTQALHRLSYAENYGPLAFALASTSLMGRGVGALFNLGCRGTRFTGLGLQIAGGTLKLGAESFLFPVANALGSGLFGQSMGIQNYWGEAWHGAQMMLGLNLGARLGQISYLGLHGIKALGGAATRLSSLSKVTRTVFPLGMELSALTTVGSLNGPGDIRFHLAESMATMLHLRGAQGLNACAFPGLTSLMNRMDWAAYEALRGAGSGAWRSLTRKWNGVGGGLSSNGFQWAVVGPRVADPFSVTKDPALQLGPNIFRVRSKPRGNRRYGRGGFKRLPRKTRRARQRAMQSYPGAQIRTNPRRPWKVVHGEDAGKEMNERFFEGLEQLADEVQRDPILMEMKKQMERTPLDELQETAREVPSCDITLNVTGVRVAGILLERLGFTREEAGLVLKIMRWDDAMRVSTFIRVLTLFSVEINDGYKMEDRKEIIRILRGLVGLESLPLPIEEATHYLGMRGFYLGGEAKEIAMTAFYEVMEGRRVVKDGGEVRIEPMRTEESPRDDRDEEYMMTYWLNRQHLRDRLLGERLPNLWEGHETDLDLDDYQPANAPFLRDRED